MLSADAVLQWNQAVLQAIRNDKPSIGFETRDLAIVQTAIYDAVNAIDHTSSVFKVQADAPIDASPVAAADAAGLFTASALFPTDTALFQATYLSVLAGVPAGQAQSDGLAVGEFVADQTLISRVADGANAVVPYTPGTAPGDWRPTPPAFAPAQTPQWPFVTPFALTSGAQFRPPPPPSLTSAAYTAAFNEVKDFGRVDSTVRTPQETAVAQFWEGKAGTPQVPGYWNEIAESAALSQGNTLDQDARLFAELDVALADAIIGHFDAKYTYNRWRPITAIQLADQTGNPNTVADPNWTPLNKTPPNPSYISGHGAASGAAAAVLADFFGTDNISFKLTSEDLAGVTHSFSSFSAAATEAENSVVWGGIHFRYDATAGDTLGRQVAGFVQQNFFKPAPVNAFLQTNLVSDIPGLAAVTDPQLVNPWGLTASNTSPFWVSDNQTGFATLYNGQGTKAGLVVTIPSATGSPFTHATPTGTVFNTDTNPGDFEVTAQGKTGPVTSKSIFLFDTLDGTIDGWNGTGTAAIAFPIKITGAVYTGLAIDTSTIAGNTLLYAADWGNNAVEVFNGQFQQVDQGAFQDKAIPKGFRPFNVQDVNGQVFVTYARFDPKTGADTGVGGFVAEFTRDGVLEMTIANGHFDSPWGLALAPANFGAFGGDLLVGNFGDGHINAFDPHNGRFLGTLDNAAGKPITIGNLWALRFGNGNAA
ncbi:MAG TPA: TIGR03118 family protein, partial [Pirellulales bacterium]|nr:TIGR03118 family protein [Pirellulales bacterium]